MCVQNKQVQTMHMLQMYMFYLLVSEECFRVSYSDGWWIIRLRGPRAKHTYVTCYMFTYSRALCMAVHVLFSWQIKTPDIYYSPAVVLPVLNHVSEALLCVFCRKCKQLQRAADLWLPRCVGLLLLSVSYGLEESGSHVPAEGRIMFAERGEGGGSQFP